MLRLCIYLSKYNQYTHVRFVDFYICISLVPTVHSGHSILLQYIFYG
jgi:hypothetical protein